MTMRFSSRSAAIISIQLLLCATSFARNRNVQEVSLPTDYGIDLQLGFDTRAIMLHGSSELLNSPANDVGNRVFQRLVTAGFQLPFPWKLTLVDNSTINASSNAGGQVYVYGGMVPLLGNNEGLWAAVLSHEVSHTGLRHQVKTYLQMERNQQVIQYYRFRIANGDKSANWALLGFQIAAPMALHKMEREEENQADTTGMLIMAHAGYHPDFVFSLHHLLRMKTGEQSKFGAFFSDHPRWETRDQRSEKEFQDALNEFNQRWPDAGTSPGGAAPLVAFMEQPSSTENKKTRTADISLPLHCHNATDPVLIKIQFERDGIPVKSLDPKFSNKDGNLEANDTVRCPNNDDAGPLTESIPSEAVGEHDRKLKARAWVLTKDGSPIENSVSFDVHVPKAH